MKIALALATAAGLLLPLTAGAAAAQDGTATSARTDVAGALVTCDGGRCEGTDEADTLFGGPGDDLLRDASPLDKDRHYGGPGNDTIDARDGDSGDLVDGDPGKDACSGDPGDSFIRCE